MDDPLIWVLIVIIIISGAFFSATETSFASANKIRLKVQADDGSRLARLAVSYIDKFEKMVIATVLGSNLSGVVLSTIATLLFVQTLHNEAMASLIASIVATLIFYFFCDTLPKAIARSMPNKVALFGVVWIRFFIVIFYPIIILFVGVDKLTKKIIKKEQEPQLTDEDFSLIIEKAEAEGELEEAESELIQSALEFADTTVKDVFTPKNKMVAINLSGLTKEKLHQQLLDTSFSRLPIYKDKIEQIVGIIHVRTYFHKLKQNPNIRIEDVMVKPFFVKSQILIDELFEGFAKHKTHLAIVLNYEGKVVGMVTMEDILEEIVGNINELTPKRKKEELSK